MGEWKPLGECKQTYKGIAGKTPPRWPMPVWVLRRMQPELVKMWEWMRTLNNTDALSWEPISEVYAGVTDVRAFLQRELSDH